LIVDENLVEIPDAREGDEHCGCASTWRLLMPTSLLNLGFAVLALAAELSPLKSGAPIRNSCIVAAAENARDFALRRRAEYDRLPVMTDKNSDLRRLSILRSIDQGIRQALERAVATCDRVPDAELKPFAILFRDQDSANQKALQVLLDRIGWPIISKFGDEADQTAFLIVQHATNDLALQQAILAKLARLLQKRETTSENYALLYDRVQEALGKLQKFGTQGTCERGRWVADSVEDPTRLDTRRRELGLPTIAAYAAKASEFCK
jgi:hypothetical protein